jgi:segregation and condensation protein B
MDQLNEITAVNEPDDVDDPGTAPEADDPTARLARIIESVLFAAAAPVSLRRLVDLLDGPTPKEVQAALARLREQCAPGQRGILLHDVAGGYQFRTARENAAWVRGVFRDKPARLGRATLETLAIIAYKQPVTRAEIEAIRGVDVDGVLSSLLARHLIKIAGRKEAVGRPLIYATTLEFLETFGLKDLNELPSLKELGPAPDAEETATPSAVATAEVDTTVDPTSDSGTAAADAAAPSARTAVETDAHGGDAAADGMAREGAAAFGPTLAEPDAHADQTAMDGTDGEAAAPSILRAAGPAARSDDTGADGSLCQDTAAPSILTRAETDAHTGAGPAPRPVEHTTAPFVPAATEAGAHADSAADGGTPAEASQPSRGCLAAQSGGADPSRPGAGERANGDGARNEGESPNRPHHD